jgi:ADP-heptose:LPS heptosyltransferase
MANFVENILVIKLSALGDFIQALGAMRAIRTHHPNATITLLTTKLYADFGTACGYFNHVWIDERPKITNPVKWFHLRQKLNAAGFSRVYDLQNNDRTAMYFKMLRSPKPEWVGAAKGASHQNKNYNRKIGHSVERLAQNLGLAGIADITPDRLDWMAADISVWNINPPYVLFVPGCAPQHPYKRWPAQYYAYVAQNLVAMNIQPVLIGTKDDSIATDTIAAICPEALNLTGQTSFAHIVALARHAAASIGNDTGPMHLIAATGCPSLTLFSAKSDPERHAPRGDHVSVLQSEVLADLPPHQVIQSLVLRDIVF